MQEKLEYFDEIDKGLNGIEFELKKLISDVKLLKKNLYNTETTGSGIVDDLNAIVYTLIRIEGLLERNLSDNTVSGN